MAKLLKDFIKNMLPKEHSWKIVLFQNWANIVGNLRDKVIIDHIRDDVLYLGVIHPAWAQELQMLAPMLKTKINDSLDYPRIKAIRFRVIGSIACKKNIRRNSRVQDCVIDPICKKLSKDEEDVLNNVIDGELRNVLYDFGVRCKKLRGGKR